MIEFVIINFFLAIIICCEINLPARIKTFLGYPLTTSVKILDCFPCFSFWFSAIAATADILVFGTSIKQSIISVILIFIIAKFYENGRN